MWYKEKSEMNVRDGNVEVGVTATGVNVKAGVRIGHRVGLVMKQRKGLTAGQVWGAEGEGGIARCGGKRGAS